MQLKATLLMLAASASAAIIPRQDTRTTLAVTNFYVGAIPEGSEVTYGLDVTNVGNQADSSCQVSTIVEGANSYCSGAPPIPGFSATACNGGPGFSWKLSQSQSPTEPPQPGYILQLNYTYDDGTTVVGCDFIYQKDFTCTPESNQPGRADESYNGSHALNLTATEGAECVFA